MQEWVLPFLAFVGGAGSTWLLLRVRFERFEAMDARREQNWNEWRREVDLKLHALDGRLLARVDRIEAEIGDHQSGMRGALHAQGSSIHYHGLCLWAIAQKVDVDLPPPEKHRER